MPLGKPFECFQCGKTGITRRCSRCKTFFCSPQCAAETWDDVRGAHRMFCTSAAAIGMKRGREEEEDEDEPGKKKKSRLIFGTLDCQPAKAVAPMRRAPGVRSYAGPPIKIDLSRAAKTLWSDEDALESLHSNEPLRAAAIRRDLRRALEPGIYVTTKVVTDAATLERLRAEIGLPRDYAGTYLIDSSLEMGNFSRTEAESIREQVESWCAMPESAQMDTMARDIMISRVRDAVYLGPSNSSDEEEMLNERGRKRKIEKEQWRRHPVPVGQLTAVAARRLGRATFLGSYGGELVRDVADEDTEYKVGLSGIPPEVTADKDKILRDNWSIDGRRYRNQLALINDIAGPPDSTQHYQEYDADTEDVLPPSVSTIFMNYWHRGVPHVGVVTIRDVESDSELLIDYGQEYWNAATKAAAHAAQLPVTLYELRFYDLDAVGVAIYNRAFARPTIAAPPPSALPDGNVARLTRYLLSDKMNFGPPDAKSDLLVTFGGADGGGVAARLFVCETEEQLPPATVAGRDVVASCPLETAARRLAVAAAVDDLI